MDRVVYFVIAVLLIGWAVGFIAMGLGIVVHSLLVAAVAMLLFKLAFRKKRIHRKKDHLIKHQHEHS